MALDERRPQSIGIAGEINEVLPSRRIAGGVNYVCEHVQKSLFGFTIWPQNGSKGGVEGGRVVELTLDDLRTIEGIRVLQVARNQRYQSLDLYGHGRLRPRESAELFNPRIDNSVGIRAEKRANALDAKS